MLLLQASSSDGGNEDGTNNNNNNNNNRDSLHPGLIGSPAQGMDRFLSYLTLDEHASSWDEGFSSKHYQRLEECVSV